MSLNALSNVNVVSESNVITYFISRNLCFFALSTLKFSQSFLVFSLTKFSRVFPNFTSINSWQVFFKLLSTNPSQVFFKFLTTNSSQVFTLKFTFLPNKKSLN